MNIKYIAYAYSIKENEISTQLFGCESSPISRNVRSLVSQSVSALDKCKIRLNKAN